MVENIIHNIHKTYVNTVSKLTPTLTESEFIKRGVLTPEEFVAAGDLLVFKCSTWSWATGDPTRVVSYLPKDKQFLITRNVPCTTPAEKEVTTGTRGNTVEDEWFALAKEIHDEEIPEIDLPTTSKITPSNTNVASQKPDSRKKEMEEEDDDDDNENIPDMEEFDDENNLVTDDAATLTPSSLSQGTSATTSTNPQNVVVRRRTYDITILYNKYYQTPHVWLYGYDEYGQPLKDMSLVYRDVSEDHAKKTVTIDIHPHLGIPYANIHPCRHAQVMKKIIDIMIAHNKQPRVDQYLFLFLKFLSAVIPTIEYDFTFDQEVSLLQ
jgi:ubiquitin-like-conjugating enzyme ATG3